MPEAKQDNSKLAEMLAEKYLPLGVEVTEQREERPTDPRRTQDIIACWLD